MQWRVRGSSATRAQRKRDRERWVPQAVVRPAKPAPSESGQPQPPPQAEGEAPKA